MASRNRIWILTGKKVSGSITRTEEQELEMLLQNDPEAWYVYEVLSAVWQLDEVPEKFVHEIQRLLNNDDLNDEEFIRLTGERLSEQKKIAKKDGFRFSSGRLLTIAAMLICVLFIWLGIDYYRQNTVQQQPLPAAAQNEIIAPNGSQTQVVLSDGTKIRLNSGSKLTYSKNFNSSVEREVYLVGEAYFEVVHDESRPFVIRTPAMDIKDLGTTFNVKAYPNSAVTEATLIEGIIEVSLKNERTPKKILMQPSEKIVVYNHHAAFPEEKKAAAAVEETTREVYKLSRIAADPKTNELAETAWMNNKLVFKNKLFGELVKDMERKYNVQITIKSEILRDSPLTGSFKDETLEQALKVLQYIAPFNYSINHEKVFIY